MGTHQLLIRTRRVLLAGIITALYMCTPLLHDTVPLALAEDSCIPPAIGSGVQRPTGADANTFTYTCTGPHAGQWTSPYYVYDPATGDRTALYAPDYSYDCATHIWTKIEWAYSPASGKFFSSRIVVAQPPGEEVSCTPVGNTTAGTLSTPESTQTTAPGIPVAAAPTTANTVTPPGTAATLSTSGNTAVSMNNTITLAANSGNANVVGNTTANAAHSGNAQSTANIANLLQSAGNAFGPDTAVFSADINGDVNGDFMFDPTAVLAAAPAPQTADTRSLQINTAADTTASIHNQIDVGATSGYATVANNTSGGDAVSGDANAVVNLMNLINTTVGAGRTFVGTININGNLNGDILLPPGVLDALIAASGGTGSPASSSGQSKTTPVNLTTAANNTVTLSALTNITSEAIAGNASVLGNTAGGSANSGNAASSITVLNLTGSNVIGKNSLLVFVNVLGNWVGMIMNAPEGSTTAALAGGMSNIAATPDSSDVVKDATPLTNTLDASGSLVANTVLEIVNDITLRARSGDASVTGNTAGGNATSGDAKTAANILNIQNSALEFSDWLGVLFINVFGTWNGSFGVNTNAGDPVPADNQTPANPSQPGPTGTTKPATSTSTPQHIVRQALQDGARRLASFAADTSGSSAATAATDNASASDGQSADVLGYNTPSDSNDGTSTWTSTGTSDYRRQVNYVIPLIGLGLAMLILVVGERDRLFGSKK